MANCPRPIHRLIHHRTRGLSGPFFQNAGGVCVKSMGNFFSGPGSECPDPLLDARCVFWALDSVASKNDNIVQGLAKGIGDAEETRTSSHHTFTHQGKTFEYLANEVAYYGGMPVRNVALRTDHTFAQLSGGGGTPAPADNPGVFSAQGYSNGVRFPATATATQLAYWIPGGYTAAWMNGRYFQISLLLKLGNNEEPLGLGNSAPNHFVAIFGGRFISSIDYGKEIKSEYLGDGVWRKVYVGNDSSFSNERFGLYRYTSNADIDQPLDFLIESVEDVTYKADVERASPLVVTSGAARLENFDKGERLEPLDVWNISAPLVTNQCLQTEPDNTAIYWSNIGFFSFDGGSPSSVYTARTVYRHTNDGGGARFRAHPISNGDGSRTDSVIISIEPHDATEFRLNFRNETDGTSVGFVDIVFGQPLPAGVTKVDIGGDPNVHTYVFSATQTAADNLDTLALYVYPTGVAVNTNSVTVHHVSIYEDMPHQSAIGLAYSPIFTNGAQLNRAAVTVNYDLANHDQGQGVYVGEFWLPATVINQRLIDAFVLYHSNVAWLVVRSYDGVLSATTSPTPDFVPSSFKAGVAYGSGKYGVAATFAPEYQEKDYAGGFAGIGTHIRVGVQVGANKYTVFSRNVRRYDVPYSEGPELLSRFINGQCP